jgi:MFS family permease
LFIYCEGKVKEPILPLRLFKNTIFRTSLALSLVSGMVMFGAIIFLPEYQQIVRGYSATRSGLYLLPLVFGLMSASVISGRVISKIGRYKLFPILGSILMITGFWLFSHITLYTSQITLSLWMLVLGAGIGFMMQVMILAVQNSVDRSDLGTATSAVTFFRTLGGALGTALFGAVLTNRLAYNLHKILPPGTNINTSSVQNGITNLGHVPLAVVHDIFLAFSASFRSVYLWALPLAALSFVFALLLKEKPLQTSIKEEAAGEGFESDRTSAKD